MADGRGGNCGRATNQMAAPRQDKEEEEEVLRVTRVEFASAREAAKEQFAAVRATLDRLEAQEHVVLDRLEDSRVKLLRDHFHMLQVTRSQLEALAAAGSAADLCLEPLRSKTVQRLQGLLTAAEGRLPCPATVGSSRKLQAHLSIAVSPDPQLLASCVYDPVLAARRVRITDFARGYAVDLGTDWRAQCARLGVVTDKRPLMAHQEVWNGGRFGDAVACLYAVPGECVFVQSKCGFLVRVTDSKGMWYVSNRELVFDTTTGKLFWSACVPAVPVLTADLDMTGLYDLPPLPTGSRRKRLVAKAGPAIVVHGSDSWWKPSRVTWHDEGFELCLPMGVLDGPLFLMGEGHFLVSLSPSGSRAQVFSRSGSCTREEFFVFDPTGQPFIYKLSEWELGYILSTSTYEVVTLSVEGRLGCGLHRQVDWSHFDLHPRDVQWFRVYGQDMLVYLKHNVVVRCSFGDPGATSK